MAGQLAHTGVGSPIAWIVVAAVSTIGLAVLIVSSATRRAKHRPRH
ncbi:hypothetical protein ACMATS_06050 [Streptoverticillium reticulum]